ncbi:tyrosine-type recombinase/integrase [Pseudoroseicyclus aestuarii]|uniref:tyrosine-type recombinase/integrase n=1 Tax=Pseudoroseicyclus aestuarii TaxID=1795041 RepID=UPI001FE486E1|nr:site-specific integrase [Pseudoroseicyclus aestuarii]
MGDKPAAKTLGYTGKAVLAHFGSFRPDQVTRDLCRAYAVKREAAGRSQGTIQTELGHLAMALNFGRASLRQASAGDVWRPNKPAPKDRWLTHEEIDRLLAGAGAPHIRLAIHLLLSTAARVGAILDLTWDRVDLNRGQIDLRLPDSRTRKGRAVVPMNSGLRTALTAAHDAALSDFVVEYAGGQVKSIRKGFDGAVERAQLKDVTIHTLRHTAAVHMAAAGIDMRRIAQFLGHTNTATTERVYARFAPDHLADAAEVLDFVKLKRVH